MALTQVFGSGAAARATTNSLDELMAMPREARRVAAIIPGYNEAETIGAVIDAARGARLIDEVIAVDNNSSDATAAVAAAHGAKVVSMPVPGKGQAMGAGVAATDAPIIVFMDSDLTNFTPAHIDSLVQPVLDGEAGLTLGAFDRGAVTNAVMERVLPNLTGQRAMPRSLFANLTADDAIGWRTEAAINQEARRQRVPTQAFVLDGMFHVTKEEKLGSPFEGTVAKIKMLATAGGQSIKLRARNALGIQTRKSQGQPLLDSVQGAFSVVHTPPARPA